jgi:hypothetical protein
MTIRERTDALGQCDPGLEVCVVLLKNDGTGEQCEIDEISAHNGNAQLEIYEADEE